MARIVWKEKAKYENFYASDVKLNWFAQNGLKLLKFLKDRSFHVFHRITSFSFLTDSHDIVFPSCFVDINSWQASAWR